MRYNVEVTRISYARQTVEIEADTVKQAKDLALETASEGEFSTYETEYEISSVEAGEGLSRIANRQVLVGSEHTPMMPHTEQRSPSDGAETAVYRIWYQHCNTEWEDLWSCACNSECPVCGGEIEPYDYERIDSTPCD